jgi:hypothetical protein
MNTPRYHVIHEEDQEETPRDALIIGLNKKDATYVEQSTVNTLLNWMEASQQAVDDVKQELSEVVSHWLPEHRFGVKTLPNVVTNSGHPIVIRDSDIGLTEVVVIFTSTRSAYKVYECVHIAALVTGQPLVFEKESASVKLDHYRDIIPELTL